jgi:hypothetical protein
MRYTELIETTRNLGGFNVKVVAKVPGGEQETDEALDLDQLRAAVPSTVQNPEVDAWAKERKPEVHRIGLTVIDPHHPMVSKRKETIQKSMRVTDKDKEKAITAAIRHMRRKGYKVLDHHYLGTVEESQLAEERTETKNEKGEVTSWRDESEWRKVSKDKGGRGRVTNLSDKARRETEKLTKKSGVDEAIKLDAPQKSWSRDDMQDYLTRIKTGTKTKQDRFKPIIHGSNVKAITKDDGNEEWDLDDLARQITTRPRAILGTNAKMAKSKIEGSITYDLTLPALSGIVVDEETGEFVEITTCPGAGECQLYCYARKGGYVMFPASSMSAAQALNFLVNHPSEYMEMFDQEVKKAKALAKKNGIKLLVRVHDAGDFFSKEYYDLVMGVKEQNPDCKFYFYTKMGAIASADQPDDVIGQFSPGAKSREVKTVQVTRDAGKHVKDAVTLPKDMFRNLFVTDAKGKYIKDEKGRTQVKSPEDWAEFKQKLANIYKLDPDTIVTYDEMNRIPEGPKPKWNVVVFPAGHGDLGASRLDVSKQFLMFH